MRFDLVRRALVVAGGNSAVSAFDMVLVLVLMRWLEPVVWNEAAVILMIYGTCRGLGQLSIQEGIYFFYGQLAADQRRGLVAQTALLLTCSAILMALGILTLPHWLAAATPPIADALPLIALAVILELPSTCTPQVLIAAERAKWASAYQSGTGFLNSACVAGPLVFGLGIKALAGGLLLSAAIRFSLFLTLTSSAVPRGALRISSAFLWRQVTFTAPLALSVASGVLNRYIDKWIVSGFEPDKVGTYTFAATELPFVTSVGYAMSAILSTRMTFAFQTGNVELARNYWLAACARGALLVGPVTLGILLVAPEAIQLFLEPEYAIALAPFQIYNLILLQRVMGYGMMLRSAGKPRVLWFLSVGLLTLNTLFSLPLTWYWGIAGAAAGTLLASAVIFAVTMLALSNVLKAPIRSIFPWRQYGTILLLSGVAALAAHGLSQEYVEPGLRLAVKAGVYILGAAALVLGFGVHKKLPSVPEDSPELAAQLGTRR